MILRDPLALPEPTNLAIGMNGAVLCQNPQSLSFLAPLVSLSFPKALSLLLHIKSGAQSDPLCQELPSPSVPLELIRRAPPIALPPANCPQM